MPPAEQQQIAIMRQVAKLIVTAADLTRAVAYEDGSYVRADLAGIGSLRSEILNMIYEWKPELLAGFLSGEVHSAMLCHPSNPFAREA